jgi:hemolysin III
MPAETVTSHYNIGEEIANSITHGLGIVLAITGLVVLVCFASLFGNVWHIVSCSIFGATLILLYTASTVYHSIPLPRAKRVLQVIDHSAIFLLIAGTYTPFTLVNLRGPWGWTLFGLVWALAISGVIIQATPLRRWHVISLLLYLGMGWMIVAAAQPLLHHVSAPGLALLLGGGIAYTGGVVFYLWRRLPFHHAIWHLFVLTGSVLHFFAILFSVIPFPG